MSTEAALTAVSDAVRAREEADRARARAIRAARDSGASYRAIANAAGLAVSHVHAITQAA